MDLGAYVQIEDLDELAKKNGIDIPRLRGYRLMSDEKAINLKDWIKGVAEQCVEDLCEGEPFWNPNAICYCVGKRTDHKKSIYCPDGNVAWDKIHGKKRKILKTMIHNKVAEYKKQADMFNKYVGRDDVLYIHARIGGNNWAYYHGNELMEKPWFLDKVDDAYDCTYCDIYAKINKED